MHPKAVKRYFLPQDFTLKAWEDISPFIEALKSREIPDLASLKKWLADYSELTAALGEDYDWRYIRLNKKTDDAEAKAHFDFFLKEIHPHLKKAENELDQKLMNNKFIQELGSEYKTYLEEKQIDLEIFRAENVPLFTEMESLEQEYGAISGAMNIEHNGETLTFYEAQKYLLSGDRSERKTVFEKINQRRLQDQERLETLFDQLLKLRHQIALNAGFQNFRDYKFKALHRTDYKPSDCENFHRVIRETVIPLQRKILKQRKHLMGLESLRPYDLGVDPQGRAPLSPFTDTKELFEKSREALEKIDPEFGEILNILGEKGCLDLDSRRGKAPGGFNSALEESGLSFIFMNGTGRHHDIETLFHEAGHALQAFYGAQVLDFVPLRSPAMEVAEVSSMAMELLSMDHWGLFYSNPEDLDRAKQEKWEDIAGTLISVAKIDAFQHWIYTNPHHTRTERVSEWERLEKEYSTGVVDQSGYEEFRKVSWHRILHIFEVPFYYIEYGFAQLGALSLWKNYQENPRETLKRYKQFLHLGQTKSIPECYKVAGIEFQFSSEYVKEIMKCVEKKIQ